MARAQSEITDLTRERKKEREKKREKKEKKRENEIGIISRKMPPPGMTD